LTGVTVSKERRIREGFENKIPSSIADFARRYRESDVAKTMNEELERHLADQEALERETSALQAVVQREKHKYAIKREPHTTSYALQVKTALVREYQQRWGDQWCVVFVVGFEFRSG
jgi:ATP-binding cassette subfamily G (WHITE) protein 2 (SNQ2)